ncbi:MAG: DsbA family protein [Microgenomates group bacterium]
MAQENPFSLSSVLSFMNNNFGLILLVGVFFVGGAFAGSLWTENQLLGSGATGVAGAPAAGQPTAPAGPTEDQIKQMPPVEENEYSRGADDAKITLVEYSDLECPFCQRHHETMVQVMEEFDGDVKWVMRHYPLSFHQYAQKAAEAAECVGADAGEEAFWQFVDAYFERTTASGTGFPLEDLAALGEEFGADANNVQGCLDNDIMASKVQEQMAAGTTAGVSGTPGTFIVTKDGVQELIPGALPIEQIRTTLQKYL